MRKLIHLSKKNQNSAFPVDRGTNQSHPVAPASAATESGRNPLGPSSSSLKSDWLNTKEAADYLRISPKCLLNLTSNGKVKHYKFGRRNRYLLCDLKELLLSEPKGGLYGN
jgi:excisionase family DNA binding protein